MPAKSVTWRSLVVCAFLAIAGALQATEPLSLFAAGAAKSKAASKAGETTPTPASNSGAKTVPATKPTVPAKITARADGPFRIFPDQIELKGNFARLQLVVIQAESAGKISNRSRDLSSQAKYESGNAAIVSVSSSGRVIARGNGDTVIHVTHAGTKIDVPVTVSGVLAEPVISYTDHVMPILSKAGCNMGACHASQYGKGGLKLSVFGFSPAEDQRNMVRDHMQRRINKLEPAKSLLLLKPTMQVPHGGGSRLKADSVDHQILSAWIASGTPGPQNSPKVKKLHVTPRERVATSGEKQQLRVEAEFIDGSRRDVTSWTKFDSMDEAVLNVNAEGLVTVAGKGQATVMARYEGQAEISTFVVPYSQNVQLAGWKNNNFVDELAAVKFRELGIEPAPLCDDATFLRRAYLDAIGTMPTVEEARAFLKSTDPKKREKLIDQLLGLTGDPKLDIYNDQYAAYWTLKWSDLLKNKSQTVGEQGMWSLHNWIKEAFRTNKPYNQFVTELVTAKGSIFSNGPANFYRINANGSDRTESVAQLFLGIRMQCAKCHHHPFEKYSTADYNGFTVFFSRVGSKNSSEFGLFGGETVITVSESPTLKGTPLDAEPVSHPLDLRISLAEWLTSPKNDYFARSVANRYVGYLLGRGLVEPVDDMRETNPSSNVALLEQLAQEFVKNNYDLKKLIRTIMVSRLYQLDSQPTRSNASDRRFYSHYKVKRLPAEALLDSIDSAAGTKTKFRNLPLGTRAIELPDAEYPDYFLKTFAKPIRASVCECERTPDENLAQALHTLNGDILASKISDGNGRIARLLKEKKSHEAIVEELYLATLSRYPSDAEMAASREFLKDSPTPKDCYEDMLWALINSKHFLFVR